VSAPVPLLDEAARAVERLCGAVRPAWRSVRGAGELIGLPERVVLHAGPPLPDPSRPPAVLLSSAVMAILHEGWAPGEATAEQLVRDGRVSLQAAQQWGGVLPLAAVATRTTPLVEVVDLRASSAWPRRAWSLLSSGAGPQIRFGAREPALLERLGWRDRALAPHLATCLDHGGPIELWPIAAQGLAAGDDLHAQTSHASAALAHDLGSRAVLDPAVAAMLERSPLFFLTLWMAACQLMLQSAGAQAACGGLVLSMAGNGQSFGLRIAGTGERWFTTDAPTPQGPRIGQEGLPLSPLVGDSGVVDAAGFGAQAFGVAPALAAQFAPWRRPPDPQAPAIQFDAGHAALVDQAPALAALRLGLDAHAIARSGHTPEIAIAMLAADGRAGLADRGIARTPLSLFAEASVAATFTHPTTTDR
jgi:hypothetical protein